MPLLTPCHYPGCRRPVPRGERYCDLHKEAGEKRDEAARQSARRVREKRRFEAVGSSADRGYGYRWQKLRNRYIAQHPYCVECLKHGKITLATDVDHIRPHRGDPRLLYDEKNLQSLCHSCHARKTASEDGGLGNRKTGRNFLWKIHDQAQHREC